MASQYYAQSRNPSPFVDLSDPVTEQGDRFTRHRGPITCAAPVPGTSHVITSGYDGAVALFDTQSDVVDLLGYHAHLVNRVSVDPSGRFAASSSSDFNIHLWDLEARERIRILRGHSDDVEDFVFIDERRGASVSRDWRVLVWDLETGAILRILLGHGQDVLSITQLDGRLYTAGDDMTLRVWDLDSGRQIHAFGPFDTETDTCAIDPIHRRAVLGCDDGLMRVFDIDTGKQTGAVDAHGAGIKKVACSPANGDLLSAAYDQRIRIWDAHTLEPKGELTHHFGTWERSFNWSVDGKRVFAGTFDGTVLVWDVSGDAGVTEYGAGGDEHRTSAPGNACFNDVALLDDDSVAAVSDDGLIRTGLLSQDQVAWTESHSPATGRVLMNAITAHPRNGDWEVVVGAHDQSLQCFTLTADGLRQTLAVKLGRGPINCIAVADQPGYEGQYFVACYTGVILRVSSSGEVLAEIRAHDNAVKALALHPSRTVGVSCSAEGVLASWDFVGNKLREYPGHMAIIDDVDLSPTGQLIASVGRDFSLKVHDFDSGVLLHSIGLGKRSPKAVAFLEDHLVLVTNYWGELLRVDLRDGEVHRRQIAQNGISGVGVRDGRVVVSSYDGGLYLVQPDDLAPLNVLREMTQRVQGSAFVD